MTLLIKNGGYVFLIRLDLIMNKHNHKPTDMFNKQYVTVYFIY